MELKGRRFLITGGAGFIGSHVADRLLAEGASGIIILDNFVRGSMHNIKEIINDPRVRLEKGDIRDVELLMDLASEVDGIFHMAALRITACAADPREAMEVMLVGTHNVLEAMRENKVDKLVYSSSASVYGLADTFPTNENHHPYNNRTYYGAAKTAGELMARSYADMYGMRYIGLRYFNVYGPRMDIHGKYTEVLIRWMDKIDAKEQPLIFGNGSQTMDFVFVHDVADANILAMRSELTDEVFNAASGTETSLLGLLQTLLRVMGTDLEPEFLAERSVSPVPRRLACTKKAENSLGFKAEVGLEKGLTSLVGWRKDLLSKGNS